MASDGIKSPGANAGKTEAEEAKVVLVSLVKKSKRKVGGKKKKHATKSKSNPKKKKKTKNKKGKVKHKLKVASVRPELLSDCMEKSKSLKFKFTINPSSCVFQKSITFKNVRKVDSLTMNVLPTLSLKHQPCFVLSNESGRFPSSSTTTTTTTATVEESDSDLPDPNDMPAKPEEYEYDYVYEYAECSSSESGITEEPSNTSSIYSYNYVSFFDEEENDAKFPYKKQVDYGVLKTRNLIWTRKGIANEFADPVEEDETVVEKVDKIPTTTMTVAAKNLTTGSKSKVKKKAPPFNQRIINKSNQ